MQKVNQENMTVSTKFAKLNFCRYVVFYACRKKLQHAGTHRYQNKKRENNVLDVVFLDLTGRTFFKDIPLENYPGYSVSVALDRREYLVIIIIRDKFTNFA